MATEQARKRVSRVKLPSERTFGLELEFCAPMSRYEVAQKLSDAGIPAEEEGYNHRVVSYWKVTTDASVLAPYGSHTVPMELVSPPLSGKRGLEKLRRVMEVLNNIGCRVNNTCGLHVHHDSQDLTASTLKDMAKYYAKYERVISEFMYPIRRGRKNGYCKELRRSIFPRELDSTFAQLDCLADRREIEYAWIDRQVTLNLQPIDYRGTVEFRHHDATLDYAEVVYWIAFTQSIVEGAKAGKFNHITVRMSEDINTMFRLATVQPVVRWHFKEQQLRHENDDPDEYLMDGAEYDELDDEFEDEEEEEYVDWEDNGDYSEWEYNNDGVAYLPQCNCPFCRTVRGDFMRGV